MQNRDLHAENLRQSAERAAEEMKQLRERLDVEMARNNAIAKLEVDMTKCATLHARIACRWAQRASSASLGDVPSLLDWPGAAHELGG